MNTFKEISPLEISANPFQMVGKDWTLITAKKGEQVNTMTASWGGMGVMWGQNVVFIFVRQSRFTKEFLDGSDHFSLTFFEESERKNLAYLGSTSGRDEDKIAKVGYEVAVDGETPYFGNAKTVLLCKKLSSHFLGAEGMVDENVIPKWYSGNDEGNYHTMYIGAIEKVLKAE